MDREEELAEFDIPREFSEVCRLYDKRFGEGSGGTTEALRRGVKQRAEVVAAVAQTEAAREEVKAMRGLKRATWVLVGATIFLALAAVADLAATFVAV